MKMKEILSLEEGNDCYIHLIKEGIFWRAYNKSAFLLTRHIRAFKVTKKRYKVVQQEIVYVGFPDTIITRIIQDAEILFSVSEHNDRVIKLALKDNVHQIKKTEYDEWFYSVKLTTTTPESKCKEVFNSIHSFPILEKTPIESQLFLVQIKKQINGFI